MRALLRHQVTRQDAASSKFEPRDTEYPLPRLRWLRSISPFRSEKPNHAARPIDNTFFNTCRVCIKETRDDSLQPLFLPRRDTTDEFDFRFSYYWPLFNSLVGRWNYRAASSTPNGGRGEEEKRQTRRGNEEGEKWKLCRRIKFVSQWQLLSENVARN